MCSLRVKNTRKDFLQEPKACSELNITPSPIAFGKCRKVMEKLRQLWLTEMQVKYPVEHSGVTYTKERGRSGLLPGVSSFLEVYAKLSRVLPGPQWSSAQALLLPAQEPGFSCVCAARIPGSQNLRVVFLRRKAWPGWYQHLAWLPVLALSIFPNNLILIANRSQIPLARTSLGRKQLPVRYLVSLGPSGV